MVLHRSASAIAAGLSVLGLFAQQAVAFDASANDNLAVYWGQNSYGATHTTGGQQNLSYYCQDDVIDVIPIAFLNVFFDTGGLPSINLANICNNVDDPLFSGTDLPECQWMAADIETCQAAGKIVTISLGGATGSDTFSSTAQAQEFANTIWNLFLGGSSADRPFGAAVLDGVDLDIEGGSGDYFPDFVTQLRTLADGADKTYYVSGAPQCPFPDAYMGSIIDAVGFDMLYVQFYNNWCGLTNFDNSNAWDFGTWDNWAKTTSPNPNIKIYIGAPASSTAAGSGYVDASTLAAIIDETRSAYSSFGGVMLWDASQAYANDRYDEAVKSALVSGGSAGSSTASSTTTKKTTTATTTTTHTTTSARTTTTTPTTSASTTTVGLGQCAGVSAWVSNVAYVAGDQVVYNGYLWTALYWNYASAPGGASDSWTSDGLCSSEATVHVVVSAYEVKPSLVPVTGNPKGPGASATSVPAGKPPSSSSYPTPTARARSSRFFKY